MSLNDLRYAWIIEWRKEREAWAQSVDQAAYDKWIEQHAQRIARGMKSLSA